MDLSSGSSCSGTTKIGGNSSKRVVRKTQAERNSRIAALSRISDMKRSVDIGTEVSINSDLSPCADDEEQSPPSKRPLGVSNNGTSVIEKKAMENGVESKPSVNGKVLEVSKEAETERIAILDCGAQYGKVIDRRVRESNVLSEMFPLSTKAADILARKGFRGIIISGGPSSVYSPDAPQIDPEIFNCGLPVLGICYGFQLLNKVCGGNVGKEHVREDGQCSIGVDVSCPLFYGLSPIEKVLLTHGDSVTEQTVANGFKVVATSGKHVAAISCDERNLYGVQFHPEVDLTVNGKTIFANFLFRIANCKGDFTMESREKSCIDEIRAVVGDKKVLVMVSGGVDSTVCAALLHKALGVERVTAIHIDNGCMRDNESDAVVKSLNTINLNVHHYSCSYEFFGGTENGSPDELTLSQVVEPEIKRRIIGNTFIRVKDRIMAHLKLDQSQYFLAQGTLRPDLIESANSLASGHADTIKTHHNDTALVRELRAAGRVIEPLKDFHKDEVRELGHSLGLPGAIVQRHPFPGPGLAIRILCADMPSKRVDFDVIEQKLKILVNLHHISSNPELARVRREYIDILSDWNASVVLNNRTDIYATLLPIDSVGVQGDCRTYAHVAALSCKQDAPIPWSVLVSYAQIIPKLLHGINRVVYVFGDPIVHHVEDVTITYVNHVTVEKLQKADRIATNILFGKTAEGVRNPELEDCSRKIQQMPVVMIPIHFDRDPNVIPASYIHSFCLRPFVTSDFMTGIAAIPGIHIPEKTVRLMADSIKSMVRGTSRVMIDLTSKPPGTTEWE